MEEWREIKGFEGKYIVSSEGVVKNVRTGNAVSGSVQSMADNYKRIVLTLTGEKSKQKHYFLHRIVALAFPEICGEYFEGAEVDHLDGDPLNNSAENIRFVDHADNMKNPNYRKRKSDAEKGKKHTEDEKKRISEKLTNSPLISKVILQYDMDGNLVREWPSIAECRRNGYTSVFDYLKGRQKTAYGYHWEYKN